MVPAARGAPPEHHDTAADAAEHHQTSAAATDPPPDAAPPVDAGGPPVRTTAAERYTVYTATYRLALKGVDRGKWEVAVTAEADAPLGAIDTVVRGVQRRAAEGADAERLGPEAFAAFVEDPACAAPAT